MAGCVAIAGAIAAVTAIGVGAGVLSGFQDRATDSIFPRGRVSDDVVIVGIDARSLAAVGQPWPWPRSVQAGLLHAIAQGRPKVTLVDELFAPPADGDAVLAKEIADDGNVVLAGVVTVGGADRGVLVASGATTPADDVAKGAYAVGVTAITPDPNDGVVRRVPLVVQVDQALVPSLSLAAVAAVEGVTPDVIVRPHGVQVGTRTIPTDAMHRLRVSWPEGLTGSDAGSVVSAADVLAGRVDVGTFRDKVVFVGVTDPTLGDNHLTPLASSTGQPGVLVQVAAFNTMANRNYLEPAGTADTAAWVFLVALIVALAVQFLPLWGAVAVTVAVPLASVMVGYVRADHGTVSNFVYPIVAVAVAVAASGGLRYATETRRRLEVARLFSQYVPEPVAEQLLDEGRVEEAMAGQRLDISCLFCDLRGFTAMAAELVPELVNQRLTRFYEYVTGIVLDHGGTLMQYVGDEVFAIFGAPIPTVDHAARAVACARQLQEDVGRLDAQLAADGSPVLRFGIGLNSGEVVAAHAGSTWRRQYTVIGHTVNVGARLCSLAGPGQVVLAEDVRARVESAPAVEPMGPTPMKGVRDDFVAWRLVLDHEPSGTADREDRAAP